MPQGGDATCQARCDEDPACFAWDRGHNGTECCTFDQLITATVGTSEYPGTKCYTKASCTATSTTTTTTATKATTTTLTITTATTTTAASIATTTSDKKKASGGSSSAGAAVGAAVGGITVLALAAILLRRCKLHGGTALATGDMAINPAFAAAEDRRRDTTIAEGNVQLAAHRAREGGGDSNYYEAERPPDAAALYEQTAAYYEAERASAPTYDAIEAPDHASPEGQEQYIPLTTKPPNVAL